MQTGIIKRLVADRGFGFIAVEGNDKDLFFHSNELEEGLKFEDLKEGDKVQFEVTASEKGDNATKVSRVDATEAPVAKEADAPKAEATDTPATE